MSEIRSRSPWQTLGQEFLTGATRPSWPALVGCLLVATLLAVLCLVTISPELMARGGYGYFFENRSDEYAYLSAEACRWQIDPPEGSGVFYFGASALREAITGSKGLQEMLLERTGRETVVYNMTAGGLTFWEMIALVDQLPLEMTGVVVLPVSPTTLTRKAERLAELTEAPRLAVHSPSLDEECRLAGIPVPERTGNYFRDNLEFFLARLDAVIVNLVRGPVRVKKHLMDGGGGLTPAAWERAMISRSRWVRTYADLRQVNLPAYERLLARLAENPRFEVVLVGSIWNPDVLAAVMDMPGAQETSESYRADVDSMVERFGATYLDASGTCDFANTDFIDTAHITNKEARTCFTASLADAVASKLGESAMGGMTE